MAQSKPVSRPATYEDVENAPPHRVAEIINGELILSPRPRPRHSCATTVLGGDLNLSFQRGRGGPGGWWILFEPELHLGGEVLVPDIAGWKRERLPVLPEPVGFTVPPDWICEVLSPCTRRIDRIRKLPLYASFEVAHAWLVDPEARTLEVFRLEGGRWMLAGTYDGTAEVRAEPFDAIVIELGALWEGAEPGEEAAGAE